MGGNPMSAEAQGNKAVAAGWSNKLMIAGVVTALIGLIIAFTAEYTTSSMMGFILVFYYALFIGGGLGLLLMVAGLVLRFTGRK